MTDVEIVCLMFVALFLTLGWFRYLVLDEIERQKFERGARRKRCESTGETIGGGSAEAVVMCSRSNSVA